MSSIQTSKLNEQNKLLSEMDFSKLKDGEAILVKTFYGKKEDLYLDHNKVITPDTQGDPLYARYAIDWAKTKKESSPDAIAFFKDIESGRSITTSGTVRWNKNGFTGLTYGDIKSTAMTYMTDPEVSYNRWVQSETITVKEKKTSRKYCKIRVLRMEWVLSLKGLIGLRIWYKTINKK